MHAPGPLTDEQRVAALRDLDGFVIYHEPEEDDRAARNARTLAEQQYKSAHRYGFNRAARRQAQREDAREAKRARR